MNITISLSATDIKAISLAPTFPVIISLMTREDCACSYLILDADDKFHEGESLSE